ncbi:hypothetical protein BJ085DRAFT_30142 [Dimargaris cristalligena]|uniref:Uncharacterized protein n=1 Tax=Dimargaris cristalligena TaxID=215637 RepID=A0A4P9ZYJ4_9FUNG|nr:hypothetical protein BJ085DRAFT_30142 [Dimargaris cristalligena]|eukprot:RKP38448.1 hypothetical protein BJ085DRAFT_30142 [Dimargaris cristalligena]
MSISHIIISGAVAQGQLPGYSPSPSNSDITPTQPPHVIYRVDCRMFDPSTPIITPSHLDLPDSIPSEPITPAVAQSGDLKTIKSNLSNDNECPQVLVEPKATYSTQPHPDNLTTPLQPSCDLHPCHSVPSPQTPTVPLHTRVPAESSGVERRQPPIHLATPSNGICRSSLAANLANTPQAITNL